MSWDSKIGFFKNQYFSQATARTLIAMVGSPCVFLAVIRQGLELCSQIYATT